MTVVMLLMCFPVSVQGVVHALVALSSDVVFVASIACDDCIALQINKFGLLGPRRIKADIGDLGHVAERISRVA